MQKFILKAVFLTCVFSLGIFVAVVAMRCDRGHVLLVNALEIDQPGLRLFSETSKQTLLWAGSLEPGGVEELILQRALGTNMVLEGVNAATGQQFSQWSYYVSSDPPYGTYIFLIEPYGIRIISHKDRMSSEERSASLFYDALRTVMLYLINDTRCLDTALWQWWNR